jgi:CDP-diglyceride synthetase
MSIKSLLTEPPKNNFPKLIYGFLVFNIVFLLFAIWNTYTASPQQRHNTYGILSVWILLMLNFLAFQFPLKPIATATLRILAMLWTIAVLCIILSHYTK